jgi:TRAP-type transport system large permease protein
MIWLGVAFAVLLVVGVPIAFALGLAGIVGMITSDLDLVTVPQRMFTSVDSFVLLAAPFYILAGEIMNRGGLTDRLIRLSMALVGRFRGGTAYANIVASVFFAGISGTAIADTAALGQIFIHGMPKEGYTKNFAAAVTVASSMIGPIIPPSVIMVIYAAIAQVSVIKLFIAGIVPGLLMGLACAAVVFLYGLAGNLPKTDFRVPRREFLPLARDGLLVASLPAFIVVGTLSGAFTATEAGGVAVVYAIILGFLVFRHLSTKGLWQSFVVTGRTTATLFLVISCVSIASYVLTLGGIGHVAGRMVEVFDGQPILFMFMVALALLVLGAVIDPGVQVLLFVPILMPIARAMNIDEAQFSMIVLLTGTLSLITPPVGVVLFVACRIGKIPVWTMFKSVFPFLMAEFAVVILLIFFPVLSNGLPSLLYAR